MGSVVEGGGVGDEGGAAGGSVEGGTAGGSVGGGDITAGVVGMRRHTVAVIYNI